VEKEKRLQHNKKKNKETKNDVEEQVLEEVPQLEKVEETKKSVKKNTKNVKIPIKEKESIDEEKESNEEENENDSSDSDTDIDNFISEQTISDDNNKNDIEEENENNQETLAELEDEEMEENMEENEEEEEEEEEQEERAFINNIPALNKRYNDIRLDTPGVKIPWIELQTVTYDKDLGIDDKTVHDDLKRELAFYEQGLAAALEGRKKYKELNKPFSRPNDYFAEMVKTDEQMSKIRQNMIEESESIKNA